MADHCSLNIDLPTFHLCIRIRKHNQCNGHHIFYLQETQLTFCTVIAYCYFCIDLIQKNKNHKYIDFVMRISLHKSKKYHESVHTGIVNITNMKIRRFNCIIITFVSVQLPRRLFIWRLYTTFRLPCLHEPYPGIVPFLQTQIPLWHSAFLSTSHVSPFNPEQCPPKVPSTNIIKYCGNLRFEE